MMLTTNSIPAEEPGYYEDSSFGIRLENIAQIVSVDTKYQFKQKQFLTFETITLVPVQKKLLNPTMLTEAEVRRLDFYRAGHLPRIVWLDECSDY